MRLDGLAPDAAAWAVRLSRFGFAALGLVLLLVGGFLVLAAWTSTPDRALGLGDALALLLQQPAGRLSLGVVALGLAAYGVYNALEARCHRIAPGAD